MVDTPTRGSHIVDIFLTNRPSLVAVIDGISDHEAISLLWHRQWPTYFIQLKEPFTCGPKLISNILEKQFFHYVKILSIPTQIPHQLIFSGPNFRVYVIPAWTQSLQNSAPLDIISPGLPDILNAYLVKNNGLIYNQARETNDPCNWTKYYALKRECQYECRVAFKLHNPVKCCY